ncbi:acyltransferase [Nocardia panacis]|uniref:Phthiocerol/phthiodiolone dimycocerosyl transferase n=1 Tax=Nocardia panacis TaxID=2340916 RepID=A0A3A4KT80_9NOCA|nr:acyltransferase [Nocardia panacis]RJO79355.1 acyltransferase [Nocardia panacis]
MTTATVIRPLAPSEEIFAPSAVYVGYGMRISGRPQWAALAQAFEALVRAHPVLGAHIADTELGHVLLESSCTTPEFTLTDGDPERLLTGASIDQRAALGTLCAVRDGERASITLATHHSIADATHSLALLRELWEYYRDLVSGRPIEARPHEYPRPVEDLLEERGIEKIPNPDPVPRATIPESDQCEAAEYVLPRATRIHLTPARTAALREVGHRAGVTINSLVAAAVLATESVLRELPLNELIHSYSVDLRTRLTPRVGPTEGSNVLGFTSYAPAFAQPPTLLGLARDIHHHLRAELAAGVVQQSPLHLPDIAAAGPPRIPGVVLTTNWGRIPVPPTPPGLRCTDFRSTMIAKPDRTGRRPDKPDEGTCIISTFRDRLSIELHHPESTTPRHLRRAQLLESHLLGLL